MPMGIDEGVNAPPLVGTQGNPARDPKASKNAMKGTVGDRAFMDAVMIVGGSWVLLFLIWYSLRNHNA